MTNPFLTNINLEKAIKDLNINQDQKDALIARLPQLDEEDRLKLLDMLKDIMLLNLEEADAIEKIKENWQ